MNAHTIGVKLNTTRYDTTIVRVYPIVPPLLFFARRSNALRWKCPCSTIVPVLIYVLYFPFDLIVCFILSSEKELLHLKRLNLRVYRLMP